MSFLVVANFKSNKTLAEVKTWLEQVSPTEGMVVAPSTPHLAIVHSSTPAFTLAAQDVSPFPPGSYTGAVSAVQLKELGVSYCIVGHSERRRYFHETSVDVASKVNELVAAGITPILCMESADVTQQFAALNEQHYANCLYCFEPAGEIGGTTTAETDEINAVKKQILNFYSQAKFMYGGSVTENNIESLLPLKLDGVLVATASLDPLQYLAIVKKLKHAI